MTNAHVIDVDGKPAFIFDDEGQRQLTLLALAHLALLRPGFDYALALVADVFQGREMYEEFKRCNADRTPPQDLWPHPGEE